MYEFDITIAGAGLAGALAAKVFGDIGLRVALFERRESFTSTIENRLLSIAYGSKTALENWGLWIDLEAEPILSVRVADGYSSSFVHFDHDLVGPEPMGYMVPASDLHANMLNCVSLMANVKVFFGVECFIESNNECAVSLRLSNNEIISTSLHLLALGKTSPDIFQVKNFDYGQVMMTFVINHEYSHCGVAVERFFPDGPFAVLPRKGGFSSSIVWTGIFDKSDPNFLEELERRVDYLGKIEVVGEVRYFPISLRYVKDCVKNRIVGIGDMVHSLHPLAGQGFNLTIRDLISLEGLIKSAYVLGVDIGSANILHQYSLSSRVRNSAMIAATDALNALFSSNSLVLQVLRRQGMGITNRSNKIKRAFALKAMGLD